MVVPVVIVWSASHSMSLKNWLVGSTSTKCEPAAGSRAGCGGTRRRVARGAAPGARVEAVDGDAHGLAGGQHGIERAAVLTAVDVVVAGDRRQPADRRTRVHGERGVEVAAQGVEVQRPGRWRGELP